MKSLSLTVPYSFSNHQRPVDVMNGIEAWNKMKK
jgi:hypothetical protein